MYMYYNSIWGFLIVGVDREKEREVRGVFVW